MFSFESARFDDAEITNVIAVGNELHVAYNDWKERPFVLKFKNVLGYQCFSPEGRALSHGTVEIDDPFLQLAHQSAEEDTNREFKVFSFTSAWGGARIVRVVATDVEVAEGVLL